MPHPERPVRTLRSKFLPSALMAGILFTAGCANTTYLLGSATGHLKVLQAARPVDDWLTDNSTPPALRQRLLLARDIRRFAVNHLHLPDNASYQRYANLQRRAVVWNVVAAPPYSLTLKTWCFPVTGCVGYRGYFEEQEAKREADSLREQGLEASVYGVPAYSTLGWMNWLGGDPLLSTFIQYPQGELARMVFHELSHQVVYVKDDTAFNESFATAVERLGSAAWLASQTNPSVRAEYASFDARRRAFRALAAQTRVQLKALYTDAANSGLGNGGDVRRDPVALDARKAVVYAAFRQAYAELKPVWGGQGVYDAWVANANNGAFGALASYDDWVPAFEALFDRQPGDWRAFYAAVRLLAKLPRDQRTQQLTLLQAEKPF